MIIIENNISNVLNFNTLSKYLKNTIPKQYVQTFTELLKKSTVINKGSNRYGTEIHSISICFLVQHFVQYT